MPYVNVYLTEIDSGRCDNVQNDETDRRHTNTDSHSHTNTPTHTLLYRLIMRLNKY